jgi:hypothetical protein
MNTFIYVGLLSTVAIMSFPMRGQGQAADTANAPSTNEFRFDGGFFRDFTRKLGQQFGTNFLDILDVRGEEAARLPIPKMKHKYYGQWDHIDWSRILKLYNQISEEGNGFLGKWIFTPTQPRFVGDGTVSRALPPETLIFMPPQPAGGVEGAIKVRAFPIRGMPSERLKKLTEIIEQESRRMQQDIASGQLPAGQDIALAQGRLSLHEGSDLLIAVGGKAYVELVNTVVDAFFVNYPFMRSPPPQKHP